MKPTTQQWWAFCESNVLKIDWIPTFEEFCNNEILWTSEPLTTKFKHEISVEGSSVIVTLVRTKDGKSKRFTFVKPDLPHHLVVRTYNQFMSSLTDDQCDPFMKG